MTLIQIPTDPRECFERFLPAQFRAHVAQLEALLAAAAEDAQMRGRFERRLADVRLANAVMRVVLAGEGGGSFDLVVRDGRMTGGPAENVPALVTLSQTYVDWRESIEAGVGSSLTLFAEESSVAQGGGTAFRPSLSRILTRSRLDRLRWMRGLFRSLVKETPSGRDWVLELSIGKELGGPPDATIQIKYPDLLDMETGRVPVQQSFMSGKIQIVGNAGLAMQIGTLMLM